MPLQATSGAASYDGFGGGVVAEPNYIESCFSTYLYTGDGSTSDRTITNGIDLSTNGGLIWSKARQTATYPENWLADSASQWKRLLSESAASIGGVTNFYTPTTSGFLLTGGGNRGAEFVNQSNIPYASWTFRKQPKFFDVQTWTGTGANRTISHSLGSVPGCILVKRTDTTSNWQVYHRSLANTEYIVLNSTAAKATGTTRWNSTTPTSTVFSLGTDTTVNASGGTYVAYLFAHDAGGFGLTGTDNVISCGSWTSAGSTPVSVNLGYEPQWIFWKRTSSTGNWYLNDNMRGMPVQNGAGTGCKFLYPNLSDAEYGDYGMDPTSTGFNAISGASGNTFIYIAIRRGPMKVPTSGTSVFAPVAFTGTNTTTVINAGFPMDMVWIQARNTNAVLGGGAYDLDRLRGNVNRLFIPSTSAESASLGNPYDTFDNMTGLGSDGTYFNNSAINYSDWFFRRAPNFFDEVCETSTSATNKPVTHNLAAVPELIIVKKRSASGTNWVVYASAVTTLSQYLVLNTTAAKATSSNIWGLSAPTSTTFNINENSVVGSTGSTYVAYLFATCAGVSKVGSYTGTGTTKQVDCGFTGGARFVLIKRASSTGSWYVWDSSRGIVSGNDPYLLLNSTAAEVTNTDYIDTYSAGFEISSTAPAEINASGGSFIFLAIS